MGNRERRYSGEATHEAYTTGGTPPTDARGTALWLLARGLWPVPVSPADDPRWPSPGKSPLAKGWGRERPTAASLRRAFARHPRAGVALLLGPAGGIVDLESDEPAPAAAELARIFPAGIPETIGWRSARGEHRLFVWEDRLGRMAGPSVVSLGGGALELRLGAPGKQVASVCPPSVTTGGTRRAWNGCWRIARFPEGLFSALCEARRCTRDPARPPTLRGGTGRASGRRSRYAAAALVRESELVRGAQPGGRNRTLNRAAFSLGQLVADGAIDRRAVETILLEAALECGLATREAEATIRSGIEAGLERPRIVR